ncbi:hypothetical protein H2199_005772 [Coniosporium tulheliwenetii]|uniref:Uncharacterized protein n=1 Tax=Coniosporium tulheliwenetii TaxID=3383036 RepID=A0ACC2Z061_9PEZI|nr:hypothetical protein H2199_005772 [Cladosporium sp. JES 115]
MSSVFRVPPGFNLLDNNHFYDGPPAAKPSQKKFRRKSRSKTPNRPFLDHGWTDIDSIVDEVDGTVLGPNAEPEPEAESVLTPTMKTAQTFGLLYSEDPVIIADDPDSEDYPTSPEGWVSDGHDLEGTEVAVIQGSIELDQDPSGRLEFVQSANTASTSDIGDGNQPEAHDIIPEADRGLLSSRPNRVGGADEGRIDGAADSQAHSSGHEDRSTAAEMMGGALAAPKQTHRDDGITSDQPSLENNKRKRCQTADTDDLGSQTPDTATKRPLDDQLFNAQPEKQQTPRPSLSDMAATVGSLQEREPSRLTNTKSSHDVSRKRRRTVRPPWSNAEPESVLPSPVLPQTSNSADIPPWYGCQVIEPSGLAQQSLSNVTIHPLPSSNVAFVTAIIRDARDIATLLAAPSVMVLQGPLRKLNDVNVKSLPSNLWLLTGIIHNPSDGANLSSTHIAKANHAHRDGEERTTRLEVLARHDDERSSEDSEHSTDSDLSEDDLSYDNERSDDAEEHQSSRKHVRWSPVDDERLIRLKNEGKDWKCIFKQFPGRSQASVRSRWYVTLRSKAESF